jgi:hypothetical protein
LPQGDHHDTTAEDIKVIEKYKEWGRRTVKQTKHKIFRIIKQRVYVVLP